MFRSRSNRRINFIKEDFVLLTRNEGYAPGVLILMSLARADTLESYANITNKSVSSNLKPASVAQNYQYNGPQVHVILFTQQFITILSGRVLETHISWEFLHNITLKII